MVINPSRGSSRGCGEAAKSAVIPGFPRSRASPLALSDHDANGLLDGGGKAGTAENVGQAVKADLASELVQRPDVT
jgi:hypothetical protein